MQTVGLFKRLVVMVYDGLLLMAVVAFTSAIVMAIYLALAPESLFIDPATLDNPKIVKLSDTGRLIGNILFSLNALVVSFLFYGWFWTHGGQTLGMKAWSLYLIKPDGKFVDWRLALKRYLASLLSLAVFGLGFTWILLNRRRMAWHDLLTNTQIVRHKPQKN